MIPLGVLHVLKPHADGDQLVPGAEDFGPEEFGCVIGGKGLVDFEGCDLSRNCIRVSRGV